MTERQRKPDRTLKSFAPPSDAVRVAGLLEREDLLTEQIRLGSDASYRRRLEIEEELSEIRRELKDLGFRRSKTETLTNPAAMLRGVFDSFRLSPGETLFREGDEGDRMYVVLEGRMDILVGEAVVETAGEGGIVGEMALIDEAPRAASVVATTLCRLVAVDRKRFHSLVQSNPAFATHVMKVLVERLRNMNRLFNANEK